VGPTLLSDTLFWNDGKEKASMLGVPVIDSFLG
jgi:hypothetical protein